MWRCVEEPYVADVKYDMCGYFKAKVVIFESWSQALRLILLTLSLECERFRYQTSLLELILWLKSSSLTNSLPYGCIKGVKKQKQNKEINYSADILTTVKPIV